MGKDKFEYDLPSGWKWEKVNLPKGKGKVYRYGILLDRAYIHMGNDAPSREDGALFDRVNPGTIIMPVTQVCQPHWRADYFDRLPKAALATGVVHSRTQGART